MAAEIWNGDHTTGLLSHADNWVSDTAPTSTGSAIFSAIAASADIDVLGGDMSAILLVTTTIEDGCYVNFGSRDSYLHLDTDYLYYNGSGRGFLQIDNSTEIHIEKCPAGTSLYTYGLNLTGTTNALLTIDVTNGEVGVAAFDTESATFTTIRIASGNVWIGDSVTNTTLYVSGGTVETRSEATTTNLSGGVLRQQKNNPTTLNIYAGTVYYNSVDYPTTVNVYGGLLDVSSEDARAKSWAGCTINLYPGGELNDPAHAMTGATIAYPQGGRVSVE